MHLVKISIQRMAGMLFLYFKLRHQTGIGFLAASLKTFKLVCNVTDQVILFRQLNSDTLAIVIMAVNLVLYIWLVLFFSFCPLLLWIIVNQFLNCIWKEQFQFHLLRICMLNLRPKWIFFLYCLILGLWSPCGRDLADFRTLRPRPKG